MVLLLLRNKNHLLEPLLLLCGPNVPRKYIWDLPCGHQKENHSEKGDSVPAVCVSVAVDMTLTSAAWRWALQDILMHGQN